MAKLSDLPPEIHNEILRYTNPDDHFRFADVIPIWNAFLQTEPFSRLRYNTKIDPRCTSITGAPRLLQQSNPGPQNPPTTIRFHKLFEGQLKFKKGRVILYEKGKCYDLIYPYHPPPASARIYLASKLLAVDQAFLIKNEEGGWRPCEELEVYFSVFSRYNAPFDEGILSPLRLKGKEVGVVGFVRALMRHMDNSGVWRAFDFWSDAEFISVEEGKIILKLWI
ncbi:hypothetical protein TWF694_003589 [Orbilia ellipsospora]|uniref:F-box domain-containing protein n=1 Tax=Orbilia ellipsospora TaxID=2528407 RepID=A0AAV9WYZ9_9PEZI